MYVGNIMVLMIIIGIELDFYWFDSFEVNCGMAPNGPFCATFCC